MAILKRHIPEGDQAYAAGTIINIQLPRENFWRRIFLHFVCDGDAATNVATSPMSEVFQEIRVMVDNQVLKSYKGQTLASLNCLNYGGGLTQEELDKVADKDSGDELALCIDFGLAPTDYRHMIASAELASFYLQILWSPIAFADTNTTVTFAGDLKIHSDEVVADDIPVEKLGMIQHRELTSTILSGAANTWQTIKLPLGNIYRRFIVWAWYNDLYKLESPRDFIDLFRVLHNGNVTLQEGYTDAFELEDLFDYRKLVNHREGETALTDYAGYERPLVIDFDKDVANLDEVLDTARSSSLEFKAREDGGGDGTNDYLKILTEEIIP